MADIPPVAVGSGHRIFISYRREDCQAQANGLNYGLRFRLKGATVFMDLDSIPPGEDFEHHIRTAIETCDLVLVLIGDNWLDPVGAGSTLRRLDHEDDFVRIEIEVALERGVKLIPLLVEGARMPHREDLPESIRGLARRQALELSEQRFSADMERLATYIEDGPDPSRTPSREGGPSPVAPLTRRELAQAEASLPKRVTKRWLSDTVQSLDGRQLAALADALARCRGWSNGEIADFVYLNVARAEPLIEALAIGGWSQEEIDKMVSFLDEECQTSPPAPAADQGGAVGLDMVTIPARVTESWLCRNVPAMQRAELDHLCEVLRRRRWSAGWLIDYVYVHAAPAIRPPRRRLPGNPGKARIEFPKRVSEAWLRSRVPSLNRDELSALVVELMRRGWSEGRIEDSVYRYVDRDIALA